MKRLGEYRLVTPRDSRSVIERASLRLENNLLLLDVTIPILGDYGVERLMFAVHPVSDTQAVLLGLGRNMGESIEVITEVGEEGLRYSGCIFKKRSVSEPRRAPLEPSP